MREGTTDPTHYAGFWKYIYERQAIWHRRFVLKQPRPWTDDPVLRDYSFTNAYRELDRGTQFAIDNVMRGRAVGQPCTMGDMLCRIITYRFFNRTEVWDTCLKPFMDNPLRPYDEQLVNMMEAALQSHARNVGPVFTGAYMVCAYHGMPGTNKINKVCNFLRFIFKNKDSIYAGLYEQDTPKKAHKYLMALPGVGPFNAYEFYSDMMYIPGYLNHREDDWANPGPGCIRGLRHIYKGRSDYEEQIRELRDEQEAAFDMLGLDFQSVALRNADGSTRRLSMRNVEHNLCEYSKYVRGRARAKFTPKESTDGRYISQIR
jgi:hypothetical protein